MNINVEGKRVIVDLQVEEIRLDWKHGTCSVLTQVDTSRIKDSVALAEANPTPGTVQIVVNITLKFPVSEVHLDGSDVFTRTQLENMRCI